MWQARSTIRRTAGADPIWAAALPEEERIGCGVLGCISHDQIPCLILISIPIFISIPHIIIPHAGIRNIHALDHIRIVLDLDLFVMKLSKLFEQGSEFALFLLPCDTEALGRSKRTLRPSEQGLVRLSLYESLRRQAAHLSLHQFCRGLLLLEPHYDSP